MAGLDPAPRAAQRPRYRTDVEDSGRWEGFEFRPGDIVISAPSKSGTTWTQMICALLVFQSPELPTPLSRLSPWLDMRVRPIVEVRRWLAEQQHRRFIKSHTPLDGIPYDERVTYLAVCRDPRDVAVSLLHHGQNLQRDHIKGLIANAAAAAESAESVPASQPGQESLVGSAALVAAGSGGRQELDLRAAILRWIRSDLDPHENLDTLRGFGWQMSVAWARQALPNVVLLHYADLRADLEGEMRRLASRLGIEVDERVWPALVAAAGFESMRADSSSYVPDEGLDFFHDASAFFRSAGSGEWKGWLNEGDIREYDDRLAAFAAPDLIDWMQRQHG